MSPGRHFADSRYEDFLASAAALGEPFAALSPHGMGATVLRAVEATAWWDFFAEPRSVKTGRNDLIVQMDPERGAPAASARPAVVAVAKAAAAKAGAR